MVSIAIDENTIVYDNDAVLLSKYSSTVLGSIIFKCALANINLTTCCNNCTTSKTTIKLYGGVSNFFYCVRLINLDDFSFLLNLKVLLTICVAVSTISNAVLLIF